MVLTREQITDIEKVITKAFCKPEFMEEITKVLVKTVKNSFQETFKDLNNKILHLNEEVESLHKKNEQLKKIIEKKTDKLEQQSKQKNLRIYGVKFNKNDKLEKVVCNLFENKLDIKMNESKWESCYYVQNNTNEEKGSIFIKFRNASDKEKIYGNKKMLKGSKIVIKEDLTKTRKELLIKAATRFGRTNTWSLNGDIFIFNNGRKLKIETLDELEDIQAENGENENRPESE